MSETEPVLLRWETLTKRKFDQLDRAQSIVLVTCSPLEVHGPAPADGRRRARR